MKLIYTAEKNFKRARALSKRWTTPCPALQGPQPARRSWRRSASRRCSPRSWAGSVSFLSPFLHRTHIHRTQTSKKQKSGAAPPASEDTSHILGILSSLFSNIPSASPARIRLLAKFVEGTYEKVDKLLEIRDNANSRLKAVDAEIEAEKKVRLLSVVGIRARADAQTRSS